VRVAIRIPIVAGAGIARLQAAGVEVSVGAPWPAAARELNVGLFFALRARPPVRPPEAGDEPGWAHGAGRRRPAWISGEAARADVQHWRARSSAVLTGAGTVRSDDPRLDVRLTYGDWVRQPLRVVLDPELRCSPAARVLAAPGALVASTHRRPAHSVPVQRVARAAGGLDLRAVLARLRRSRPTRCWWNAGRISRPPSCAPGWSMS
jgi:diaminohydroxyphosphoribosylaminopyrimidine deaminase / 5-amino-6-(5-phosphoribosylamino)uracil reductase